MFGDKFYLFVENCVIITIIHWISKVRANKNDNSLWITAITENQRLFATGNLTDNAHLTNMLHMNTITIWGQKEEGCSFPKKTFWAMQDLNHGLLLSKQLLVPTSMPHDIDIHVMFSMNWLLFSEETWICLKSILGSI